MPVTTPDLPTEIPAVEMPPPTTIPFSAVDLSYRYEDVYEIIAPDEVTAGQHRAETFEFRCRNGVGLMIQFVAPGIARFRYSPDGKFGRDFSYAVRADMKAEKTAATLSETETAYYIASAQLHISISKTGMRVRCTTPEGQVLHEDAEGYTATRTIMRGWSEVKMSKICHRKEAFYGLGDKTSAGASLAGHQYENWCTDSFAFGRQTNPLYRAVPFYYGLHAGTAYGIFFDNTYKTHFDFNSQNDGTTVFRAEGGEMDYYCLCGPTLLEVSRRYALLTGVHELPPIWALGYHQCRWSYYPESRVYEIADTFRRLEIPCDAIYLDIDYMQGYRCFTWNPQHFPDPKRMIDALRAQGFQTVAMIDPGIKADPDYFVYKEGIEKEYFAKNADGYPALGPVWPGWCVFPDYTRPEVRQWWGNLYEKMYKDQGISGFWNDMNEPAVFYVNHKTLPDQVMHDYDGDPASHRKAHNIYGQQMTRASWEGFRRLQPEKRPFLLTRASYAGGQRYSAVWTGDNCADWEQLQIANIQCQRLSVSGFSFCGTDIGGFAGEPDGELYVRWLQLSVFHPLMRTHSMGGHASGDGPIAIEEGETSASGQNGVEVAAVKAPQSQEPWSFGDKWTALAKKAIELRYCLLPALYTAMWQQTQDGTPVLRHAAFADESDARLLDNERDFLFGEHLFVSPVVQPKVQRQAVYLPKGLWYYFWTGQPCSGESFVNLTSDQIPFFVRAGGVLAAYPPRAHTGELVAELTLYVYYNNDLTFSRLYEDIGEGYGYRSQAYALSIFETNGRASGRFSLRKRTEGRWSPTYTNVKIYLIGFPTFARTCTVDGKQTPIREIRLRDRSLYTLDIKPDFQHVEWA